MSSLTTFSFAELSGAKPDLLKRRARSSHQGSPRLLPLAGLTLIAMCAWHLNIHTPTIAGLNAPTGNPGLPALLESHPESDTPARALPEQPAAQLAVEVNGSTITIQARIASREQVARQLAAITRSELMAAPQAFEGAAPLTLRWHGDDIEQVWRAVLGPNSAHALQCAGQRCRVWLLSTSTGTAVSREIGREHTRTVRLTTPPSATEDRQRQPDPPGLFPAELPTE